MKPASAVLPTGFQFVGDPTAWADPQSLVVRLPQGLASKRGLLEQYVRQLRLPDYFGWNFDALDECLRDLHWLPDAERIALVHDGLPLRHGSPGRRTYVALLRDAVAAWPAGGGRQLLAVFPQRTRDEVARLLAVTSP